MTKLASLAVGLLSLALSSCTAYGLQERPVDEWGIERQREWDELNRLKSDLRWNYDAPVEFAFPGHGEVTVRHRRIGFVAAEIVRHGGVVICAPIAPYDDARRGVRQMVAEHGRFVLVHVATPPYVCEARDPKGLWRKARAGLVPLFTGVSDPYEEPDDAELVLDTLTAAPEESAEEVLRYLWAEELVDDPASTYEIIPAAVPRPGQISDRRPATPSARPVSRG